MTSDPASSQSTVRLLATLKESGQPVYEEVPVEVLDSGRYRLLASPGILDGLGPRDARPVPGGQGADPITNSVVDEAIAEVAMAARAERLPAIRTGIAAAFETTRAWIAGDPRFERVVPRGGVVGFPRSSGLAAGSGSHQRTSGSGTARRRPLISRPAWWDCRPGSPPSADRRGLLRAQRVAIERMMPPCQK